MATLILRLPADPFKGADSTLKCAIDDGGSDPQSFESRLSALPRGHDIVAIAPASKCSWLLAAIPPGVSGDKAMRAAMEGALEECLLDEAPSLHLAPAGPGPGGATLVMACDRSWLSACLRALADAGFPAARVVPEFTPGAARACAYADEALGERMAAIDAFGVSCLPLCLGSMPAGAELLCEPGLAKMAEQIGAKPSRIVDFASRMAAAASSEARLDQFEFSTKGWSKWRQSSKSLCIELAFGRAWRPARWGAAALVLAACAATIAQNWSSARELQAKQGALRSLASQSFPRIKLAIDPPAQMAKELTELRASSGAPSNSDLESILSALGDAGSGADSISYKDGSATFKAAPEKINAILAAAAAKGLQANPKGSAIEISDASTANKQGAAK